MDFMKFAGIARNFQEFMINFTSVETGQTLITPSSHLLRNCQMNICYYMSWLEAIKKQVMRSNILRYIIVYVTKLRKN